MDKSRDGNHEGRRRPRASGPALSEMRGPFSRTRGGAGFGPGRLGGGGKLRNRATRLLSPGGPSRKKSRTLRSRRPRIAGPDGTAASPKRPRNAGNRGASPGLRPGGGTANAEQRP